MKKLTTPLLVTGLVVSSAIFIDSNLDLKKENRSLNQTLEVQVNENDNLRETNEVKEKKVSLLTESNRTLSDESIRLKKQVKQLENENTKLEKELQQTKEFLRRQEQIKKSKVNTDSWQNFTLTFYTPRWQEGSGDPNKVVETATGYDVSPNNYTYKGLRIIATNNNIIPLGSLVDIEFAGKLHHCIVLDNGGKMKKNPYLIDFLVPTVKEAFAYGVQKGKVKVIRKGW